ncbi:tRNA preQ1(34) S-adenosylmethionine ribosyltransferase-isomerase QueA [Desulfurispira natronophila]|uniref:S-adenosylmethionine:tRNA ribosyltransferase-isomerase n=1 Tax=Desulfurispira natronophila TaxID=682562 RepID=A0A7W8DGR4_9BACT|nr:S-adenosylmethionine:tRNA ribosyltransferase-isomerase [Desulfurispira natronophila]
MSRHLADYHVDIPAELIAQDPLPQRDSSRLLVLSRQHPDQIIADEAFTNLPRHLGRNDLLIFNDTKVIPARLQGRKSTGGSAEVFLLHKSDQPRCWQVLTRGKKLTAGTRIEFGGGTFSAIIESRQGAQALARFDVSDDVLFAHGTMPLPPYIRRAADARDNERYQTIFASKPGAVAAPTAALHFTPAVLKSLKEKEVQTARLTLHVGLGTFFPIKSERIDEHRMHAESYHIPPETLDAIDAARARGGRIIAVGTTVVRALESCFATDTRKSSGETDIFIHPGYQFNITDGIVTNFHLPDSTLILLVSAFYGRQNTQTAYRYAVANRFRFFSYGDAMMILP